MAENALLATKQKTGTRLMGPGILNALDSVWMMLQVMCIMFEDALYAISRMVRNALPAM
jgi:ABC-type enterochelin transport system permease subunit